jgi:hypothetical protein
MSRFEEVIIKDSVTGKEANVESNGGLCVNVKEKFNRLLDFIFYQPLGFSALNTSASKGSYELDLIDSFGFLSGDVVIVEIENEVVFFARQIGSPVGNVITLDTPLDRDFDESETSIYTATDNMNVDGSAFPESFQIGLVSGTDELTFDITRLMGYIQDGTAMDDSKFGGIPALTNGILLRIVGLTTTTIWNLKSNADISLLCYDISYTDKAPAGSYGLKFRNSFAGREKHGVTIRLSPGEYLEILIQDDLTDLEKFNIMAQGHVV